MTLICPACGSDQCEVFHDHGQVPMHSCLLMHDEEQARNVPLGRLRLASCLDCGFVYNGDFEQSVNPYSPDYEETQAFSPHFRTFMHDLAGQWVRQFGLHGKRVIEIGCGKGEFLQTMIHEGAGSGIGIDPGIHPERVDRSVVDRLTWVPGLFPDDWPEIDADAVVCRHTLEHIPNVADFLRTVRAAIRDRTDTAVLFEVPDLRTVLETTAFWDIYYEHCSYFTEGSLEHLFRATGFDVVSVRRVHQDQYLVIEAFPRDAHTSQRVSPCASEVAETRALAAAYASRHREVIDQWVDFVAVRQAQGKNTVIWGAGSKGVSFLAAHQAIASAISRAVDVNPFKQGKYLAGSGHRVIPPSELVDDPPDSVIVMNPIYQREIEKQLADMGCVTEVIAL